MRQSREDVIRRAKSQRGNGDCRIGRAATGKCAPADDVEIAMIVRAAIGVDDGLGLVESHSTRAHNVACARIIQRVAIDDERRGVDGTQDRGDDVESGTEGRARVVVRGEVNFGALNAEGVPQGRQLYAIVRTGQNLYRAADTNLSRHVVKETLARPDCGESRPDGHQMCVHPGWGVLHSQTHVDAGDRLALPSRLEDVSGRDARMGR